MAYYHVNETDEIVSTEQIRSEFEQFQSEGEYTGMSFSEYLDGCMAWNNGELTPLTDYITSKERRLRSALSFAHLCGMDEDSAEVISDLTNEIANLKQYLKGE